MNHPPKRHPILILFLNYDILCRSLFCFLWFDFFHLQCLVYSVLQYYNICVCYLFVNKEISLCSVSSGDCREPVSHVHVFNSAAQPQSAQQPAACFRRRTLPAVPRSFRQQDLEEHLAVRSRRPPRLRTWAWYALWLCGDGVRQQLWVPSLEHGHNEDWTISILTTTDHLHYWLPGLMATWPTAPRGLLTASPLVSRWSGLSIFALITNWVRLVHLLQVSSSVRTRRNELRIYWEFCIVCRHEYY